MYLNIWGFDNDRKVIAEKMWRSFENFENSRDNSSRSGKGGGGLEIWNKIRYGLFENWKINRTIGGIDTGWQGGTQIEVSLRCLLAVCVCSTLDRLEHTMEWLTGFELTVNRFSRVRLAMTPRRRLDVVAGKNIRFRWCSRVEEKNKLKISNNITLSRLSNFMWQVWQLSTIIVEKFILNLIKFPSSPGPCLFVIFVIIFPIKN